MNFFTPLIFIACSLGLVISGNALALDCNNKTQTDMNLCAASNLDRETSKINKTYKAALVKLNPRQQQELKEVQLAWIKFKDSACKFEASSVGGGSMYSMVFSNCLTEKTIQRNKELDFLVNCPEGDLSCPLK